MRGYGDNGSDMDKMKQQKDTENRQNTGVDVMRQNLRGSSMMMTMKRHKRGSRKMER